MGFAYIKSRQRKLEKKWLLEEELEAKEEAERVAKMEAEARKQEEIVARKKFLLEQQENERLRQKHIQGKEELAKQKWNSQLDTLLAQIEEDSQRARNWRVYVFVNFSQKNRKIKVQKRVPEPADTIS